MTRYVAFLRAVNVAGHARTSMADVRDVFVAAGGANVATYIQSGNVVFDSTSRKASSIVGEAKRGLAQMLGEPTEIMVRSMQRLVELLRQSPFERARPSPRVKHYVVFLSRRPGREIRFPLIASEEGLEAVSIDGRDVFVISRPKRSGFFGFPNYFVEGTLGVTATSRNLSTITRLVNRYAPAE